jgi:hypothetical protein
MVSIPASDIVVGSDCNTANCSISTKSSINSKLYESCLLWDFLILDLSKGPTAQIFSSLPFPELGVPGRKQKKKQ